MRKTVSCFLFLASCLMLLASCSKGTTTTMTGDPGQVVATINGTNIPASELNDAAKGRLQKVDQEIYEIKKDSLDELIEKKLVEQAAAKQSKSVEDYLKENIDNKVTPPTEDEIKNFFESRKEQMAGKTLKDTSDTIKAYLAQSRTQGLRNQLISGLRAAADVKINIEPPKIDVKIGDSPSIGPKGAPVTIIEFTDYQCPFCKRVRPTINQIIDEYKDKVRYVLRDFPLSFHQNSKKAHEAAHCAGDQGKYWEYNKSLWENQSALEVAKLKEYAKQLKLNTKKFDDCLDSGKHSKTVEENVAYGATVGVNGTPAFFVNGITFSGARSFADFKEIIDQELKK